MSGDIGKIGAATVDSRKIDSFIPGYLSHKSGFLLHPYFHSVILWDTGPIIYVRSGNTSNIDSQTGCPGLYECRR